MFLGRQKIINPLGHKTILWPNNCCQIEIYFDFGNVKWSRYSLLSFNVSYDGELGRSGIHGGGGLCNAFVVCFSQGQVSFSVVL